LQYDLSAFNNDILEIARLPWLGHSPVIVW
jgi:hypothetical protein